MHMKKAKRPGPERLHQQVARTIGSAILAGVHAPGASLVGEVEQSAAMGVSRTAYREAMKILAAKGLIESRPKAGTHVTPRSRWALLDPDVLAWTFTGEPDPAYVRDLFELRGVIEPAAAALAAERRSEAQVEAMRAALSVMGAKGLATEEGRQADNDFHRLLLEATGNAVVVSLAGSVGAAVQWTTHFKQQKQSKPRDPLPEHLVLCEAIADGDPVGAHAAMNELLRLALEDMA